MSKRITGYYGENLSASPSHTLVFESSSWILEVLSMTAFVRFCQNSLRIIHSSSWTFPLCYLGRIIGSRGDLNMEKFCERKDGDFESLPFVGDAGGRSDTLNWRST